MSKPASSMCAFTSTQLRRLELAERVWREAPEERGEVGYLARAFVVVNLPLRDPGDVSVWSRVNGDATLTVQQGYFRTGNTVSPAGYPFGATARWLLLAVFTEAVRRQSPEVDLGSSVTAFLRELGVATDGRRLRAVQEQMARLLAASIRFSFRDHNVIAGANQSIASDYLLWRRQSGTRTRGYAVLNDAVFRDLVQHPIPLDLGAIRALRDCPLAIDLFVFFSFRLRARWAPTIAQLRSSRVTLGSRCAVCTRFGPRCEQSSSAAASHFSHPIRCQLNGSESEPKLSAYLRIYNMTKSIPEIVNEVAAETYPGTSFSPDLRSMAAAILERDMRTRAVRAIRRAIVQYRPPAKPVAAPAKSGGAGVSGGGEGVSRGTGFVPPPPGLSSSK